MKTDTKWKVTREFEYDKKVTEEEISEIYNIVFSIFNGDDYE
ncbi:hypothetical protein [Desulforamulus aeronauticus]|uniref:Uncharacterized protein n=1 Tax=Desulforamulus aeronauticus DSM 10349 TaxID=1121421 RepID=A0A1M6SC64_9FIRM|nr:hypothetical protein [Desulforamulus aeronauticus]SHK42343.1 hypothetical protein SAMN02745123_01802 [Desulforamulus aeronauticus DSM 10349]